MELVSGVDGLKMLHTAFSQGKQVKLLVTGTSMVPFLRHKKDFVMLSPVTEEPKRGQVLLYRVGDRLILHRLRKKQAGFYVMNGDGRVQLERIQPEQVEAVVTEVIRQSGRCLSCDGMGFWMLSLLWWPTRPLRPVLLRLMGGIKGSWK